MRVSLLQTTSKTPLEIDKYDCQEMWENEIEACVYQTLLFNHPKALTAENIASILSKNHNRETTKEEVGDALYDGALKQYVYRTGEAPDRFWQLKTKV